ncbi:Ldh family oxidoreductase [Sinorhizobium mexicanum]|uniref:Malate dehydrogenase n=1 Tax=Sinorhizobium mexicanum TaxID=375549 RepID=A0A859QJK6_9HYPH|nr:Ldh family oxidoreductase [Sinorhizobium mexicanum]MBP1887977.1 (2R)-3-sulfolactate dehydrogenase (NADP+) [Sinorhizobium mexicanum]QLL60036.1 malate dehydrogenase [Sinorhizobium mexicanum]
MTDERITLPVAEARSLATEACLSAGASHLMTKSLVDATLSAIEVGREELGFPHFLDYLQSLRDGRIDGRASPRIVHRLPALIHADANRGIAQLGFDLVFGDLVNRARTFGVAIFTQKNSYTAGELGYYVRRLAIDGLVSLAVANSPAVVAAAPGAKAVYGTNPLAFGVPLPGSERPLVIDQSSSATAFVNIVRAATEGRIIPEGWATDENGEVTIDPHKALRGALLAFGGSRGANIALMVEVLAAGLSGASWSLDAPDFRSGAECPGTGLTVIALSPSAIEEDFGTRIAEQVSRLEQFGVYIPGQRSAPAAKSGADFITLDAKILAAIKSHI